MEELEFALDLARSVEPIIQAGFRKIGTYSFKSADGSIVTETDLQVEEVLRDRIRKAFPDDGFLGEETGSEPSTGTARRWLVDPIDGTTNFFFGVPTCGTLIALEDKGVITLGIINFPLLDKRVWATMGEGCWRASGDGTPVRVTLSSRPLSESFVCASLGASTFLPPGFSTLLERVRKLKFISCCFQVLTIAEGRAHAGIEIGIQPWDIAARMICIREAGGKVTSLTGDEQNVINSGGHVLSVGEPLHHTILACL